MYEMMKKQNFGVEIELTGVTRKQAAKVVADYYGGTTRYAGGTYDMWTASDRKGRIWKAMTDASIRTERWVDGALESGGFGGREYSCEVVTPILQYEDLPDLENIVNALKAAGAVANDSCGIHVHVDGANHTPESLTRLLNFAVGRQDLFYEALNVGAARMRYCQKMDKSLLRRIQHGERSREAMRQAWYSRANSGYDGGISEAHYNASRYHAINLHAYFTKGTVEFRLFNSTTDADTVKAYIQFCLAMSAWALDSDTTKLHFTSCANYTREKKERLMHSVLTNRLGLRGAEFKTCREVLTAAFRKDGKESREAA